MKWIQWEVDSWITEDGQDSLLAVVNRTGVAFGRIKKGTRMSQVQFDVKFWELRRNLTQQIHDESIETSRKRLCERIDS